MAGVNKSIKAAPIYTAEGGKARHISSMQELRRTVLACMLWEDGFYESGEDVSDRIVSIVQSMPKEKLPDVAALAVEARSKQHLRHAPLLIVCVLASVGYPVADTIFEIVQRPDELSELLAIYWKDGKRPIAKQIKKGLARAFAKFNEYSLAKFNQDREIKLRDVLFMVHAKPKDNAQADLWKRLVNNELVAPDTWEVELSASKDKKASWTRLVVEEKLGGLATLRNLRNMQEAGIDVSLIKRSIGQADYSRVLPFRFIAAARYAPHYEPELEAAMFRNLSDKPKLLGSTILLVDVSGSMSEALSEKSDMRRADAAYGLAMILRELCEDIRVVTFANQEQEMPNRRGFALRDAMDSTAGGGTKLGGAIRWAIGQPHDRLVVITDEQTSDGLPVVTGKNYMINVASNKNGVGYGDWIHLDGFSEAIIDYIVEVEAS